MHITVIVTKSLELNVDFTVVERLSNEILTFTEIMQRYLKTLNYQKVPIYFTEVDKIKSRNEMKITSFRVEQS